LAAAGCGVGPTTASPARQADAPMTVPETPVHVPMPDRPTPAAKIVIDNFTFDPPVLTISAGTEVTWLNRDDVPHTATSTAKPKAFDSGPLDTDQTFSHVFSRPGEYEYFCAVHPKMTGRVIVK
jgi:plastocyanin